MNFLYWLNPVNWFRRDTESSETTTTTTTTAASSSSSERSVRSGYSLWQLLGGGDSTALNIATVYRCVQLLSESVANLPLMYMRRREGLFVEDYNSRLHYLLTVQPDKALSAYDFWVLVVQQVLLTGNAYIVPIYNTATMELDRLALCGRGTVNHDIYADTYEVNDEVNGIYGKYREDEIVHIKGMSVNGKEGLSVLRYASLTISIADTGDKETLSRFATGGNVKGIVSNDKSVRGFGELQDEELDNMATSLDERFNALGEHIVGMYGDSTFTQISMSSADMQFLESRKFTVREICRFFGVHPSFVFDDTSNNYKSAEMANVAFLSNTLNPLLRRIEVELLRKLVAPSLYGKRKFQFDRRGLYACDLESRVRWQQNALAVGLYTPNELRQEENKPAVEGGDSLFLSANLKSLKEFNQAQKAQKIDENGEE